MNNSILLKDILDNEEEPLTKQQLTKDIEYQLLVLDELIIAGRISETTEYIEYTLDKIDKLEEITGKNYLGYRERLYEISWGDYLPL